MKLYLISQDENDNYDTYDSAVVAARDEEDARQINPGGDWSKTKYVSWCSSPDKVIVRLVGEAAPDVPRGLILASFNAG